MTRRRPNDRQEKMTVEEIRIDNSIFREKIVAKKEQKGSQQVLSEALSESFLTRENCL